MKNITIALILVALAVSMFASPRPALAAGNIYYVATNGNDSNPGTETAPWRTIQKAANVAVAGDTVYVRGGAYHEKVIVKNSGSAGNFITFSSYSGETAIIDVNGISMRNYHEGGFVINQKSYIQVIGFRVINSNSSANGGFGIVCVQSDHCVIKNNQTYNTYRSGIIARASNNVVIDGNEIELANNGGSQEMLTISGGSFITVSNNHIHDGGSAGGGGEGINVKNGARDVLIKGNHVHDNARVGIYVDAYEGDNYNITIDGNIVHNNARSGIAIEAEKSGYSVNNVVVVNNLVYANETSGIVLGDWGQGALNNIVIVNNTVVRNGIGNGHGGIALWCDRATNVVVRNNILSQNEAFTIEAQGTPLSQTTITNNLLDGYRSANNETRGTQYVMGDPLFVNSSAADFRLLANSPAINAGTPSDAPDHDFTGTARPNATAWDIGAFEYTGQVSITKTFFSNNFNSSFRGWNTAGSVTWNGAAPTIGARSVKLTGNSSMARKISTAGYIDVALVVYLGAGSYESREQLKLSWWDGSSWRVLTNIKNNAGSENNKLNKLEFELPAGAFDNPQFKIRIQQLNADANDFGYVDEIKLIGTQK